MKSVQGFVTISQYISNQPGIISPIGELSTFSRTYTKEVGQYRSDSSIGYILNTFGVRDTVSGSEVELTAAEASQILNIIREVVAYANSHGLPYEILDFRTVVASAYPFSMSDLDFGPMVPIHNIELPEYVTFTSSEGAGMDVKIWLADGAFRDQYTGYDITVIPPLSNLNDFGLTYSEVSNQLDQESVTKLIDRVQAAKENNPDSIVRVMEFNFVNQFNRNMKRPSHWGLLVYGKEGDYDDAKKDAIVEHLLANSDIPVEVWETIFPEIFQRTEFLIVPRWDLLATENLTDDSSLYSQMVNINEMTSFAANFLDFMGDAHVRTFTYTLPLAFRTLMTTVTNGLRNADGKTDFKTLFPDYLPVPTSSTDFGRVKLETQEWTYFINELVRQAETAGPVTLLPTNFRRVYRDGKLFISGSHNQINYLVAAKWNQAFK